VYTYIQHTPTHTHTHTQHYRFEALIQCALLSRSTFLGARADWTESWYSDYARGPSAYGGTAGKTHKLYETSLVQLYESEDPLHQVYVCMCIYICIYIYIYIYMYISCGKGAWIYSPLHQVYIYVCVCVCVCVCVYIYIYVYTTYWTHVHN